MSGIIAEVGRTAELGGSDEQGGAAREVERTAADVIGLGTHLGATIDWAVALGSRIPRPGHGRTVDRWSALATAAALDVGAARVLEPHLDALAILAEARAEGEDSGPLERIGVDDDSSWGVFAAEGGQRLEAARTASGEWMLRGTKPWCSLAADLSHALVSAWIDDEHRRLFAVSLRGSEVRAHHGPWVARGLSGIVSAPVDFDGAAAVPIGGPDWYLRRPGFAWGGIGVAAVWWGAATPLAQALTAAARREGADQLAFAAAGEADSALWAVRAVLADAGRRVDAGDDDPRILAERARAVTADAVDRVLGIAEHALGPGPLTSDEDYARRAADLRLYVLQHHGARDLARLGRAVSAS